MILIKKELRFLRLAVCRKQQTFKRSLIYSGCQKYESSPIFVTKLEVRLYPEFLNTQTCTFGLQICTLSTRTCIFCSTIASDFSTLTLLAHLLTTLINLVLYKHEHEG